MSTYVMSDIHGCYTEYMEMLEKIKFDPKKDELIIAGDIVDRGPENLEMLRYMESKPETEVFPVCPTVRIMRCISERCITVLNRGNKMIAATMEISNMPLTQQCVQNMIDLCSGTKTSEEIVSEICGQYRTHSGDQTGGE